MGDLVELTTWPKHQHLFYQVLSNGLCFEVKAPGNAAIGLATKPGPHCDYWIGIGDNNRCWIKKEDEHCNSVNIQTSTILSADSFNGFWLLWGPVIKLGKQGEQNHLVSYTNKMRNLRYVTFSVLKEQNPVYWRFELAPKREETILKPVSDGKFTWVDFNGNSDSQLPVGAFIGGHEGGRNLYVIRAPHRGSVTPGKYEHWDRSASISWGGFSHTRTDFQILCGFDGVWVPMYGDQIPVGAVEGGFSEVGQERLYVGRAYHDGQLIVGKVQPSYKACLIPYQGKELPKKIFEILVEPTTNGCVNKTFTPSVEVGRASESDADEDNTWQGEDDNDEYDSDEDMQDVAF